MTKVKKYVGVYYHTAKDGTKTFHIRGKIKGKNYTEVIGSTREGITAQYASNVRSKKHGIIKLGEDSPLHTVTVYTFNEASDLYFHATRHKKNTANSQSVYTKHLQQPMGNLTLEELTPTVISTYQADKLDQKIIRKLPNGKLKPLNRPYSKASVNKQIDLISTVFNYMKQYHDVKLSNPATAVKRYSVNNRRERYLEQAEVALLLNTIRTNTRLRKPLLVELFTVLALTTGARAGGVLALTKADINLSHGTVTVTDFKRNGMVYTAHIHDSIRPLLEAVITPLRPIDHVIGGKASAMHKDGIGKMLQPMLNRLFNDGLDVADSKRRVVIHTLRHTFASQLAIAGTPIFTIQKLLNHAEIAMTMRYAKLMPHQGKEDIQAIKLY